MKKSNKIICLEIIFSCIFFFAIILIIGMIFANIYINSVKINKNAEATAIMTNILENMRKRTFNDFENYIDGLSIVGTSKQIENEKQKIFVNGVECQEKFFGTDIPKDYNITVEISKTDKKFDLAKDINISIYYSIFGKSYSLNMESLIEREKIKEVNEPIINNDYFGVLNIDVDDFDIIPIKYSEALENYVVTTVGDPEWYNYSSKEWAKVIIFAKEGYISKDTFVDVNGNVSTLAIEGDTIFNLYNYMYTWIPNFSKKDNETYFRYASGKNAIKLDYLYEEGKYLYYYSVSDEIENISPTCSFDGLYGVWRKVQDVDDEYYKNFCNTKYGPINLH